MMKCNMMKAGVVVSLAVALSLPVIAPNAVWAQADIRQEDRRADRQQDRQQDRQMEHQFDRQDNHRGDRGGHR